MSQKLFYLISFILVLAVGLTSEANAARPGLIGWWKFDGDTLDSSGLGNDGTAVGNPTFVVGKVGSGAIDLDGDDYVTMDGVADDVTSNDITLSGWVKTIYTHGLWLSSNGAAGGNVNKALWSIDNGQAAMYDGANSSYEGYSNTVVSDGEWHMLTYVRSRSTGYIYVDGFQENTHTANWDFSSTDRWSIGQEWDDLTASDFLTGTVDDVQIYNRALTLKEIEHVMAGIPPGVAFNPKPTHEEIDVPRDVVLSWTPGEFAAPTNGHKVYLGESFDDVNDAVGGVAQTAASYTPAQRLDFNTTYYWRVNEVNAPPTSHIEFKGEVWQFTTELFAYPIDGNDITATASSTHQVDMGPEKTIDGSGLDANDLHSIEAADMWLSSSEPLGAWIQYELDKVYKLHQMWIWNSNQAMEPMFGLGCKDVSIEYSVNGTDYTTLAGVPEFAQAPGAAGYAHNTTVDFGGAAAKYVRLTANSNWGGFMPQYGLCEVRFFHIPVHATEPYPDSGATGVVRDVVLGWKAGREAVTHDLYISTDEQAVIDGTAPVVTVAETSYGPLALDLSTTHYWNINEVNEAETQTTWASNIWTFTTSDHIVVDDFESYNDLEPDDPESKRIFNVWIDGYGIPTNGSLVGYEIPPFCEQTIVHGGEQSMPLAYSNTGSAASSEAELTLSPAQDWTEAQVQTLVLFFHGTAGNTGQLYVKVNDSKVTYDGQASNLALTGWQAWNIDLASSGASLQNVTKLAIGIDGNGAAGTLYFDDIRLYARGREFITPSAPDDTRLIGHWKFDGDTQDSSGRGNHGTSGVTPVVFVAGKVGSNAMDFRGADYVVIDGVVDDITSTNITLSAWIKTTQSNEGNVFAANTAGSDHPFMFGVTGGNPFVNDSGDTTFPPPVNDDLWHLITYVRDGDTGYIYADGVLRGTYSAGFSLASVTRWSIGQEWDSVPSDFYTGAVDDARIYNYPLSDGEVSWLAGKTQPFDKPF